MKKIALVLAVFLCVLPIVAFADIAVSGSVSFSLGDDSTDESALPTFTGASTASGKVKLATDDEKVSASIGFNLMPAITVAAEKFDIFAKTSDKLPNDNVAGYEAYLKIKESVGFYNDHAKDKIGKTKDGIWPANTGKDLNDELDAQPNLDLKASNSTDTAVTIKTPVKSGATAKKDQFVFSDVVETELVVINTNISGLMKANVEDAIDNILAKLSADAKADLTIATDGTYIIGDLKHDIEGTGPIPNLPLMESQIKDWTANDKALVKQAVDLEAAYERMNATLDTFDPSVTAKLNFVTSASLAFKEVAGVMDITCNLMGTHVSAGNISVDGKGHTKKAVAGYPSLKVGLSSGIVEGLDAGLTLYIDDNKAQDAVKDKWYTWLDETEAQVDPKYGIGLDAGYTMAIGDMSVGGAVAFGLYDLMGDKVAWAVSVAPSFSGFGTNVGLQFDYGLDLMYLKACAKYTIMGITPSVAFHMINATGTNALAFSKKPGSVMAKFKNGAGMGMLLAPSLAVDLSELIGMGITVTGGMNYGLSGDAQSAYSWNAGVKVAGLVENLTVGFNCDADSVEGSKFDYKLYTSYVYGAATLSASYGHDWNSAIKASVSSWSLGATVSF